MKDNPVAKNAHKFNKSQVMKDRKKAMKKGDRKHKGRYEETGNVDEVFTSTAISNFFKKSGDKKKYDKVVKDIKKGKYTVSKAAQMFDLDGRILQSMVTEKLDANSDAGDYVKDFRKSDAPQFKGKSDKKKQQMAIAAYLNSKDDDVNTQKEFFGRLAAVGLGAFLQKKKEQKVDHKKPKANLGLWDHKEKPMADNMEEWACNRSERTRRVKGGDKRKKYMKEKQARSAKDDLEEGEKKGLWDRIHAKRKRGEKPAKPGEKGYPKTLDVGEGKNTPGDGNPCWDTHKKVGTKMKGGKRVNDCVPKNEEVEEGALPPHLQKILDKKGNIKKGTVKINGRTGSSKSKVTDVKVPGYTSRESVEESAQDRLDRMSAKHGLGKPNKAADDYMAKMRKKYGAKDDADLKRKMGMKEDAQQVDEISKTIKKVGQAAKTTAVNTLVRPSAQAAIHTGVAQAKDTAATVKKVPGAVKKGASAAKTGAKKVGGAAKTAAKVGNTNVKDLARGKVTGKRQYSGGPKPTPKPKKANESMDPRDFTDKAGYLVVVKNKKGDEEIKQFFSTKPAAQKYAKRVQQGPDKAMIYKTDGRKMMKESVNENFRTLATKGMGAEKKSDIKVGHDVDYYDTKIGDKHTGKIVKMGPSSYQVKDEKTGKVSTFNYYDPTKARKLMKEHYINELTQRELDMMADRKKKNLVKRGKEKAEPKSDRTYVSNRKGDDDHIVMQLRKAQDVNGNMDIKVSPTGKSTRLPKKMIDKLLATHDKLQKPDEKRKFRIMVTKELRKRAK